VDRYLLFDSNCAACTATAEAIDRELGSRLSVRSLGDPEMLELVERAGVSAVDEPVLLEVSGETVRCWRGLGMRVRLVRSFGPRQALRLWRATRTTQSASRGESLDRRGFLTRAGGTAAAALLGPAATAWGRGATRRARLGRLGRGYRRHAPESPAVTALVRSPVVAEAERTFGPIDRNLVVEHDSEGLFAVAFAQRAPHGVHVLLTNAPRASREREIVALVVSASVQDSQPHTYVLTIDGRSLTSPMIGDPHKLPGLHGLRYRRQVHEAMGPGPGSALCIAIYFPYYFARLMCQNYILGCVTGNTAVCAALLVCIANAFLLASNTCTGVGAA